MGLQWPFALGLLALIPLIIGVYLLVRKRRRANAVRFSNVPLLRAAVPTKSTWRRHIPAALLLAGIGSLGVAAARPRASVTVPISRTSIIMAMDVSRSMCATDVAPNRLAAAQDAARSFIKAQPAGTRIGIIAFAGFAEVVLAPTTDRTALIEAVNGFTTSRGTAIGAATLKALDAVAAVNPDVAPTDIDPQLEKYALDDPSISPPSATPPLDPSAKRDYVSDIVVVLTDGANTQGIEPIEAAKQAVTRGVRLYTIGFGTTNPTQPVCTPEQLGGEALGEAFGGGPGGGGGFGGNLSPAGRQRFLTIDEPTLTEMATMTGGQFYKAENADQLKKVFSNLPSDVELQRRDTEISVGFAIAGALLAVTAILLSLRWSR